jgi:hypothetical protein
VTLGCLSVVVTVVCVGGRGQKPQPVPTTLPGEREHARECCLRDDNEVDVLPGVLRRAERIGYHQIGLAQDDLRDEQTTE